MNISLGVATDGVGKRCERLIGEGKIFMTMSVFIAVIFVLGVAVAVSIKNKRDNNFRGK